LQNSSSLSGIKDKFDIRILHFSRIDPPALQSLIA